ncbi:hypothetical protein ANN_23742 [Periplaneta americana]|uniref:Uncharacterized protein n=1 Tax=Periplaneta americana TaxID=6978 RepID=A0ABQ8SN12_PERAM|nr:hypothetical protein ANN_23742 [Periplaneta americana]
MDVTSSVPHTQGVGNAINLITEQDEEEMAEGVSLHTEANVVIPQCSWLFNDAVSTTRLFSVDEIGDSEMRFGEMRPDSPRITLHSHYGWGKPRKKPNQSITMISAYLPFELNRQQKGTQFPRTPQAYQPGEVHWQSLTEFYYGGQFSVILPDKNPVHGPRFLAHRIFCNGAIMRQVLLYGCESWTLILREEQRLKVFENKVHRKIFGAKRDEVTEEWRKLHNAELHAFYSSPDIIRNIKS